LDLYCGHLVMNEKIPIVVFTNDKHHWLLRGFAYLFNTFCSKNQLVSIVGFAKYSFDLPINFFFSSVHNRNFPVQYWSNGLIKFLESYHHEYFILMLEDYWQIGPWDKRCIEHMFDFIQTQPKVLRIDLTRDRASKKRKRVYGRYRGQEIVETFPNSKYQMSFQGAIWNRDLLLQVLRPNETPWEAEILGTKRLAKRDDIIVLGTTIKALNYVPVYRTKTKCKIYKKIPQKHVKFLQEKGWL